MRMETTPTGNSRRRFGETLLAGWLTACLAVIFVRMPPAGRLGTAMLNGNGSLGPVLQGFCGSFGEYAASLVASFAALLLVRAKSARREDPIPAEARGR